MKLISILSLVGTLPLLAETFSIQSPDATIHVVIEVGDGSPTYSVRYHDEVIIAPSRLGFVLKDAPALDGPFEVASRKTREIDESWQPVWGQFSSIRNHANELRLGLVEKESSARRLDLVFQVFDDGVGFRYEFPTQESLGKFEIVNELTTFTFTENPTTWWVEALPDTYERDYNETPLAECATRGASTPVTLRTSALLGICFWRKASETAVGQDRRAGKRGLMTMKPRKVVVLQATRKSTAQPCIKQILRTG
jgi:alpha-glucosidase